jgi:alpha-ribazole phosphatase
MEVFLIRHTAPLINEGLIYGITDVALAESFDQEKQLIKAQLPEQIDFVVSSPALRCTLLANEIAGNFVQDARLTELNFGLWEGKTWDTIDRTESERWMEDFVNNCPPGGETLNEMNNRVMSFWEELALLPYQRVAVVTHAGVIRLILASVNFIPLNSVFDIRVAYGEVVALKIA